MKKNFNHLFKFVLITCFTVILISCSKPDDSEEEMTVEPTATIANITIEDMNGLTFNGNVEVFIFKSDTWENHQNETEFADQVAIINNTGTGEIMIDIPGLFSNNNQEPLRFMSFYTINGSPRYRWILLNFTEGSTKSGTIVLDIDFTIFDG